VRHEEQWVTTDSVAAVERLLQDHGVVEPGECLTSLTVAGAGNMNVTLRARSERRSVIVKQSRPFVAKYDFIAAPENRIHFEARFYEFVAMHSQLAARMPALLAWLPQLNLLVLEDLGTASDATMLYDQPEHNSRTELLEPLTTWLAALHDLSSAIPEPELFRNRELRKLNHAHVFEIPFQDPAAVDLNAVCPGLTEASRSVRTDPMLPARCRELGEVYLSDGNYLLHGDFYPGSWLLTEQGPFVIDPEFCFMGRREFDLGVLLGHLRLADGPLAGQALRNVVSEAADWRLVEQFAAIEVLRRILGVAQLPLVSDLNSRVELIQQAASLLLS
jgi:5-methylthioribose kinase